MEDSNLQFINLQTKKSFNLPEHNCLIFIGKSTDKYQPDIDVSMLPNHEMVSFLHASLEIRDRNWYICDLNSNYGTYLNQQKLLPNQNYPLKLGDKIELGEKDRCAFIFDNKTNKMTNKNEMFSLEKLIGYSVMAAGTLILLGNVRVGILFRLPGLLTTLIGISLIMFISDKRINTLGWFVFFLGIGVIITTGFAFASVSFLSLIFSGFLIFGGYQLVTTSKLFNYSLLEWFNLIKRKK